MHSRSFLISFFVAVSLLITNTGCSHATYKPEASGEGVIISKNSLIYSIPANTPVVKMKISYRGIKDNILSLHLRFIRVQAVGNSSPITLNPKDLTVQTSGQGESLTPSHIHASTSDRHRIVLSADHRQAIDLQYQLPLKPGEEPEFSFFNFHWKVDYSPSKFEEQTIRFDRLAAATYPDVEPNFPDFDDRNDAGWYPVGWGWW